MTTNLLLVHFQKQHILETGNNSNTTIQLVPPNFQVNKALSKLLIVIGNQGCSFGCYNEVNREHQTLGYLENTSSLTDPIELFDRIEDAFPGRYKEYKHAVIAINNSSYTLIPKALFDVENQENYLDFSNQIESDSIIQSNELAKLDSHLVYSISNKLKQTIINIVESSTVTHTVYGLLNVLLNQRIGKTNNRLYLFIGNNYVRVIAFEGQKLLLCNDYPFTTHDDINYFSLAVCEQVGFNPHSVELSLFGNELENNELQTELEKYFAVTSKGNRPKGFVYNTALDELPDFKFFNLFCLPTCE